MLSHYLKDHCEELMRDCVQIVVELGCGIGLVSIVASTLLSHEKATVVATDADPKLLELVERNAKKNLNTQESARLKTKVLKWGLNARKDGENGFDH